MFRKLVVVLVAVLLAGSALAGTNLVRSHLSATVTPGVTVDANALRAKAPGRLRSTGRQDRLVHRQRVLSGMS